MALFKKIYEFCKEIPDFCKKIPDFCGGLAKSIKFFDETFSRPCAYAYILFLIFFVIFVGSVTVAICMLAATIVLLSGIFIAPGLGVVGLVWPKLLCCENRLEVLQDCSIITAISAAYWLAAYNIPNLTHPA